MNAPAGAVLGQIVLSIVLAATAIILHELAHGFAALAMGDRTALRAGRLSPNPLRHVDRFGTLVLPGFLLASQLLTVGRVLFMFGWAKPVPVDPRVFRYPRQMMALVAVAGPLVNFALAALAAWAMRRDMLPPGLWAEAADNFVRLNLVLGLFNLLPVPPLDGGRIAVGLLPLPMARAWAGLERYGILLVLVLIAGPALLQQVGVAFDPLGATLLPAVAWVHDHLLGLADLASVDV